MNNSMTYVSQYNAHKLLYFSVQFKSKISVFLIYIGNKLASE